MPASTLLKSKNRNPDMLPLGIYEKALPVAVDWHERLELARNVGFDFVELSCDESPHRQARMDWSAADRGQLRDAIAKSGVPLLTMCLSAHRSLALGSANERTRRDGLDLLRKAIAFSVDLGIRIIQIAGYYDYYGTVDEGAQRRYQDALAEALAWASEAGVMLGVETMEGEDVVDSIRGAMELVGHLNSPWFQIYPDIGNIAAQGYDLPDELRRGHGHIIGIHVKDSRPGEPRRVPFGEGVVPFAAAFRTLAELNYSGPILIEMWNDNRPDSMDLIAAARRWVVDKMVEGGLIDVATL